MTDYGIFYIDFYCSPVFIIRYYLYFHTPLYSFMFQGITGFPVTQVQNGVSRLAGIITVSSTTYPLRDHYCAIPSSCATDRVKLYLPPELLNEVHSEVRIATNDTIKKTDKNCMESVFQAFDFSVSTFADALRQFGRTVPVYITLSSTLSSDVLEGTSLGLATSIAMLGFSPPSNMCFTGFVSNVGNIEHGVNALHTLIQKIDSAAEKFIGATSAGMTIFIPSANLFDILPRQNRPYGGTAEFRVGKSVIIGDMEWICQLSEGVSELRSVTNGSSAYFPNTVADVVTILWRKYKINSRGVSHVVSAS